MSKRGMLAQWDSLLSPTDQKFEYRYDIDGLRALAVALVVAFHIKFPLIDGGFIGVDMFFVVSGFLITGILSRENRKTGTIDLGKFWARRIRRLLPASTLTLVVTVLVSWLFLSPVAVDRFLDTALYVVLYIPNLFLAAQQGDYFANATDQNPLVHFWSLAVEEQFYLVWPAFMMGLYWLARKFKSGSVIVIGLVVLTVASLIHSEQLTQQASTWAYYSPLSRAWEFSIGGLLGLYMSVSSTNKQSSSKTWLPLAASVAGLGLIAFSVFFIGERSFPGVSAVPGVAGTLLVLYGNSQGHFESQLFQLAPVRWLGNVSYGWYLWHWPFIVVGGLYFDDFSGLMRLASVMIALLVAAGSYYVVEQPVRYAKRLVGNRFANYALALASGIALVSIFGLMNSKVEEELASPVYTELFEATAKRERTLEQGCDTNDIAELLANDCVWGDETSDTTVLLLGDSHAAEWIVGIDALGVASDFRLVGRFIPACPLADVGPGYSIEPLACNVAQDGLMDFVDVVDPDLVMMAEYGGSLEIIAPADWEAGMANVVEGLVGQGRDIFWIHDVPDLGFDPIECIARSGEKACTPTADAALALTNKQKELMDPILDTYKVGSFDPVPFLCDKEICSLRYEGVYTFRDDNHLTDATSESLAKQMWVPLQKALAEAT